MFPVQRPVVSKAELREEIAGILLEAMSGPNGPTSSVLNKSSQTLDKIMRALEAYGVR